MTKVEAGGLTQLAFGSVLAFAVAAGAATVRQPPTEMFVNAPQPRVSAPATARNETAIFAGGCFWGVEGMFSHVRGVVSATSSYTGGSAASALYETVSTGTTGHAEAVRVVFDPAKVSYADLLRIYFSVVADPTTLNEQGPDHGTQYRSALFPQSAAQERLARAYLVPSALHREEPDLPVHRDQRRAGGRGTTPHLSTIVPVATGRLKLMRGDLPCLRSSNAVTALLSYTYG